MRHPGQTDVGAPGTRHAPRAGAPRSRGPKSRQMSRLTPPRIISYANNGRITKVSACFHGLTSTHPSVIRAPLHVLVKKNKGTRDAGGAKPNARGEPRPEAEARNERKL